MQLKGIFGLISRLIKAEKVFAKSQESWKRVFSGGEVESKYEENRLFLRISQFHFTDFHLQVYLHYISHLIFLIKKRKIEHSYKRIDDNTTEFEFIVK